MRRRLANHKRLVSETSPVVVDLEKSFGPFLVLENGEALIDVSSCSHQNILGYNAGACFGAAQYQESWTGDTHSTNFQALKRAFTALVDRAQKRTVIPQQLADGSDQWHIVDWARNYIQISILDQFALQLQQTQYFHQQMADRLKKRFPNVSVNFNNQRIQFEWANAIECRDISKRLAERGVLTDGPSERSLSLAINLSFREPEIQSLWQQISYAFDPSANEQPADVVEVRDPSAYYRFHRELIAKKIATSNRSLPSLDANADTIRFLVTELESLAFEEINIVFLDEANYPGYRTEIRDMQSAVYEPVRQTEIEKFDKLIAAENHHAILVLQNHEIIAMAFAAPLVNFPAERGTRNDPHFADPAALYMLDLTVAEQYRGKLGRIMKQAITLHAQSHGRISINGRNRDRLAAGMWAINLSLGSFETQYLPDDYPDDEEFRDCIFYRCPLQWVGQSNQSIMDKLKPQYLHDQLPQIVNRIDDKDLTAMQKANLAVKQFQPGASND